VTKVVMVVWGDAWASHEEVTHDTAILVAPYLTESVGWLVAQNDTILTLAQDRFPDHAGTFKGATYIPVEMVREVIPLHAGPVLGDED
jgi:hypothetical protein